MRHFAGILLGIVLLPVFFALNLLVNYADGRAGDDAGGWALLFLICAYGVLGIVVGMVLAARSISPTALLVGGLLIAAAEVLVLLPKLAGLEVNIPRVYDYPTVTNGYVLIAVAAAFIFASFFPSRWHRVRDKEDEYDEPEERYAGTAVLPGDGEPQREPVRYDNSWGTGRNTFTEEPEAPYGGTADDSPPTQDLSGQPRQPGQYDERQRGTYDAQVGQYDQQALGYGMADQQLGGYRDRDAPYDPPTQQYQEPPTIHEQGRR